jgi:hypothetical protein
MGRKYAVLSLLAIVAASSAYADVGKVGAPVSTSTVPRPGVPILPGMKIAPKASPVPVSPAAESPVAPVARPAQTETQTPQSRTPLLAIDFSQKHTHFQRALREVIAPNEKAHAGASYDVVSSVPSGATEGQNQRLSEEAHDNLLNVVQEMGSLGVQSSRIHTSVEPGQGAPRIAVYVRMAQ